MRTLLEGFAYDDLEELQSVLRLTDEQKQKAFEILLQEWIGAEDEPPPPDQQRDYAAEARRDMENRLRKFAETLSEEEDPATVLNIPLRRRAGSHVGSTEGRT